MFWAGWPMFALKCTRTGIIGRPILREAARYRRAKSGRGSAGGSFHGQLASGQSYSLARFSLNARRRLKLPWHSERAFRCSGSFPRSHRGLREGLVFVCGASASNKTQDPSFVRGPLRGTRAALRMARGMGLAALRAEMGSYSGELSSIGQVAQDNIHIARPDCYSSITCTQYDY
jgi:hypothetical protein